MSVLILALVFMYMYPARIPAEIPVNDETLIAQINKQSKEFQAASSEHFDHWSMADVKKTLGHVFWMQTGTAISRCVGSAADTLPDQFDSRQRWPHCYQNYEVNRVGRCSSSWAVALASALSDRFCIMDKDFAGTKLSAQDLISCDSSSRGCAGGTIDDPVTYMISTGLVMSECFPYKAANVPCAAKCKTSQPLKAESLCRATGEKADRKSVV